MALVNRQRQLPHSCARTMMRLAVLLGLGGVLAGSGTAQAQPCSFTSTQTGYITPNLATCNLGLNTLTAPTFRLDFGGSRLAFDPTVSNPDATNILFGTSGGGFRLHFGLKSDSGATKFLTIQDNGNVGIGTALPQGKFHVSASGIGGQGPAMAIVYGSTNVGTFVDPASLTRSLATLVVGSNWNSSNGSILNVYSNNQDGALFVRGDGNVGIGTVAPSSPLHVSKAGVQSTTFTGLGSPAMKLWGGSFVDGGITSLDFSNSSTQASIARIALVNRNSGSSLMFGTSNVYANGVTNSALTINELGNVGIGTTAPLSKLEVTGNTRANTFSNTNSASGIMEMRGSGAGVEALVFGHLNANYANSIGAFEFNGYPFIAFFGRHSATPNTLKRTAGGFGVGVLTADLSGNVSVQSAPAGAANSDAALTTVATFSNGATKLQVFGSATFAGTVTGTNIQAQYQDLAEWVSSSQRLEAGTVVIVDPDRRNEVLPSTRRNDTAVAGVVSAQPGLLLGTQGEGKVAVATTGRVRVRVDATASPIRAGDLLVTSDREGYAMRSEPIMVGGVAMHRPGTLIGKALEPLASGTGEILVLLSLQ